MENRIPTKPEDALALLEEYSRKLELTTDDHDLRNERGRLLRTMVERGWSEDPAHLEQALADCTAALESAPSEPTYRHNRAALLRLMAERKVGDAESHYETAAQDMEVATMMEDKGVHWWLYARIRFEQGDHEKGRACMTLCKDRFDYSPPPRLALGVWLLDYACGGGRDRAEALSALKFLIKKKNFDSGFVSPYFVQLAKQNGHPAAEWLDRLVEVIAGRLPAAELEAWPDWQRA